MDEGLLGEGNKQRGHPTTAGQPWSAPRLHAKEQLQHVGTRSAMCTQVQHHVRAASSDEHKAFLSFLHN